MRLRTLALICLAGALVGLLLLAAVGVSSWRAVTADLAAVEALAQYNRRAMRLGTAIDYLTLLRAEPDVAAAMGADAQGLADDMADLAHPRARPAVSHLHEIVRAAQMLATLPQADGTPGGGESDGRAAASVGLTQQTRIHHAGVVEALDAMLQERYGNIVDQLFAAVAVLVGAGLAFALMAVLAFGRVYARLRRPLQALEHGLDEFAAGVNGARIRLRGNDELGRLAASFNRMAEQREQHERSLADSERRFRELAENIEEVFWLSTVDKQRLLYVSPAFERIWGVNVEQVYRQPDLWLKSIHPADRERVEAALPGQRDGDYTEEFRIVRPDGSVRWILDRSFKVLDGDGRVVRIAGVAADITERYRSRLALAERVKELRCLYRVLELTTGAQRPLPQILEGVVEVLPRSMIDPSVAVARARVDGEEARSEGWSEPAATLCATVQVDGGDAGFVEVGYLREPDAPLAEDGWFVIEEQQLVDGVAAHLSRMLEQQRLSENLAQGERLRAVGELTGGVAHDFNNLLTVIMGNAELLAERLDDDRRLGQLAQMIASAAQRGSDLTQRLLAFARRQALEPRAVDVNRLAGEMDPLLRRALGESVEIEFVRAAGLWPALVDPVQLESAVLNLCLNARDAMPDGGRLTIETANARLDDEYASRQAEVRPGQYVMMAVSDTGLGMTPDQLDKVFQPFFTTKADRGGTGLGLAMVYGFVKQSGGHVAVYSESGQGTTVRMYLPRARGAGVEAAEEPEASEGTDVQRQHKVLMVEDDELVRRYVEAQLLHLGYRVLVAASGSEALELVREHDDIDLLFTDVVMPGGLSGPQLAERALALRPGLKVLYTSGYTENSIVHHGRLDPGVHLLSKPYRRAELARRLARVLADNED